VKAPFAIGLGPTLVDPRLDLCTIVGPVPSQRRADRTTILTANQSVEPIDVFGARQVDSQALGVKAERVEHIAIGAVSIHG
jgi:hypothetical protein